VILNQIGRYYRWTICTCHTTCWLHTVDTVFRQTGDPDKLAIFRYRNFINILVWYSYLYLFCSTSIKQSRRSWWYTYSFLFETRWPVNYRFSGYFHQG
jgi:hypothetical protein